MEVKFSDFKIIPVLDSIKRADISDEEYFSKKYRSYISNSRLRNIDPNKGGTPELYRNPPTFSTSSLKLGSSIHELLLQPDSFCLAPKMNRPSAKLGDVVEKTYYYVKDGMDQIEAIRKACIEVSYYVNNIDRKIPFIIEKGTPYWNALEEPRSRKVGVEEIFLSDNDHDVVTKCLESCFNNEQIMSKLHPTDVFGNPVESYNEIAFFIDFIVTYKNKQCANLKFKMKADNYTVDTDGKLITLNDLKTTGHPVTMFMNEEWGSMSHYSYYRQMYLYSWVLWLYCTQQYGASKNTGWTMKSNMLVVQTFPDFSSRCFSVGNNWLKKGKREGEELLKRVAAYEIFGWDSEIDFI